MVQHTRSCEPAEVPTISVAAYMGRQALRFFAESLAGTAIFDKQKIDSNGRRKPMTRLRQTRRDLLKTGAAMSAAVSFAKYGITPSWSAAGAKKDGLNVVDEVLRQAADTKEVAL